MQNDVEILKEEPNQEGSYELGQWLGRKQAFSLVASKTSAADIECLKQIRDKKLYRARGVDWAEPRASGSCPASPS